MVQNPKGGGLSSSFGGGGNQQIGGVQKTTDFLDKSTWALATILIALILVTNFTNLSSSGQRSKVAGGTPDTTQTTTPASDTTNDTTTTTTTTGEGTGTDSNSTQNTEGDND
jgi:preprotein translocase subunit SecG